MVICDEWRQYQLFSMYVFSMLAILLTALRLKKNEVWRKCVLESTRHKAVQFICHLEISFPYVGTSYFFFNVTQMFHVYLETTEQ